MCGLFLMRPSAESRQEESSNTTTLSGVIFFSVLKTPPCPMPTRTTLFPAFSNICAMSAVVVVFPLVPVTPMIDARHSAKKMLESISTGTPCFSASFTYSFVQGMMGFLITISTCVKFSVLCCPSTYVTFLYFASFWSDGSSSSRDFISVTIISRAPRSARNFTVPTPPVLRPRPNTVIRLSLKNDSCNIIHVHYEYPLFYTLPILKSIPYKEH